MFTLKEEHLKRLCQINHFHVPSDGIIFFGLRGCIPINDDDHEFRNEHQVEVAETDYRHPRCIIGQWKPNQGIALFIGSTIPHIKYVKKAFENYGKGANQLMPGFYKDYRKGVHKRGTLTAHAAFRQDSRLPIIRTADDLDYDEEDRVEFMRPYDNLHAAWCMGPNHPCYGSAGCQVVVGYPKCEKRGNRPDSGPWKVFKNNAYDISQTSFSYILLNGRDAKRVALSNSQKMSARLRFGSKGELVKELQRLLKDEYYEGYIDGDFGTRTLFAVLDYQTAAFGADADDGIVGPITASALQMNWPDV